MDDGDSAVDYDIYGRHGKNNNLLLAASVLDIV